MGLVLFTGDADRVPTVPAPDIGGGRDGDIQDLFGLLECPRLRAVQGDAHHRHRHAVSHAAYRRPHGRHEGDVATEGPLQSRTQPGTAPATDATLSCPVVAAIRKSLSLTAASGNDLTNGEA